MLNVNDLPSAWENMKYTFMYMQMYPPTRYCFTASKSDQVRKKQP